MDVMRVLATVAVAAALTGCSTNADTAVAAGEPTAIATPTATATPAASTPTPVVSARPSATHTVRELTADDNGRTIHVAPGQMIALRLAPNAGSYDPPVSDDETVLRRTSHEGGYPDGGDAVARFSALAPGTARITSQTDLSCMHSTPRCMIATRVFSVTVVVDRSR